MISGGDQSQALGDFGTGLGVLVAPVPSASWKTCPAAYSAYWPARENEAEEAIFARLGTTRAEYEQNRYERCVAGASESGLQMTPWFKRTWHGPFYGEFESSNTYQSQLVRFRAALERLASFFINIVIYSLLGKTVRFCLPYTYLTLRGIIVGWIPDLISSYTRWIREPEARN
jgi:hypothetical protein